MTTKCDIITCNKVASKRVVVRWYDFATGKRREVADPHNVCEDHTLAYGVPSEVVEY